jgi:hypothetical protein
MEHVYVYRIGTFKHQDNPYTYMAPSAKAMYQNLFRHLCTKWDDWSGLSEEIYAEYKGVFDMCPCGRGQCDATRFTNFIASIQNAHGLKNTFFYESYDMTDESQMFWNYSIVAMEKEEKEDEEEEIPHGRVDPRHPIAKVNHKNTQPKWEIPWTETQ